MIAITDEYMREMITRTRVYTMVLLKPGPKPVQDGVEKIIWEHGRRNFALRAEGRLAIVCPIAKEGDVNGLAIFDASHIPQLPIQVREFGLYRLALHPGSGSEKKNWPESHWAEFLKYLVNSTEFNLLLVGGEAEGDRLQRLASRLPSHRFSLAQSLPLPDLAHLLQSCLGFMGHDSGISHLAAALGLPGLILWGDTVEAVWRPPSPKMTTIRHSGGLANLPVDAVIRAFEELPLRASSP